MSKPKVKIETYEDILLKHQKEHADEIIKILSRSHLALDLSNMGLGKTYIVCYIARYFNFPLIVVCPLLAVETWERVTRLFEVNVLGIHNYESISRANTDKQPWITRFKVFDKVEFGPTNTLLEQVKRGILYCADEFHKCKNKSSLQSVACSVFSKTILDDPSGKSRFMMLSGTIIDKEDQIEFFLRFCGYLRARNLYFLNIQKHQYEALGMAQVTTAAKRINPEGFVDFIRRNPMPRPAEKMGKEIRYFLFLLLVEVILPKIQHSMTKKMEFMDIANGFYQLEKKELNELKEAIKNILTYLEFNQATGDIKTPFSSFGLITKQLQAVEYAKRNIFARRADFILEKTKGAKLIIFLNYLDTVNYLKEALKKWNPMILTGEVKIDRRNESIAKFQEANDQHRLIIATLPVASESISLHDLDGRFPRFALISPTFSAMKIIQATGRLKREGSKSEVVVRIVYVFGVEIEQKLKNNNTDKGIVLEKFHQQQVKDGMLFPNDYPSEIEDTSGVITYHQDVSRINKNKSIEVDSEGDDGDDEVVDEDEVV